MNLDDLALQIQNIHQRVALLQRQSEQQKAQEDIELIAHSMRSFSAVSANVPQLT